MYVADDDLTGESASNDADSLLLDSVADIDSISFDSVSVIDSLNVDSLPLDTNMVDSVDAVEPEEEKDMLEARVEYQAADSIVFYADGTGYLYGEGNVKYLQDKPIELKAQYIKFNLDSSSVYAQGGVDSVGNPIGDPVFNDGNDEYGSKWLNYNFRTKKGYIRGGVTQQDEGFIVADKTKMMEDQRLYLQGGKYTTCNDHDHPHFYLQLTKAKLKPGSYLAAGPAYMVLADVPLPLAVPFGFFPFTNRYASGIIMPQFGDEFERGFFLKNGGYYWAINDYVDLEILGEIYTKGTWGLNLASKYAWRYKFSGRISANYRVDVRGEKNLPTYSKAKNFRLSWQHTQDSKASQYSSFSASVDFSTSGYNTSNINNYYNPAEQSKNITSSSVNYTQRFPNSPWSISMNVSLQQRTQDSTISLTLPSLNVNMSQIAPFKRKKPVGKERWYEKIRLSYSMTTSNSISTKENMLLKSSFVRDWKNGVKHTLPISASFSLFKYLNLSLSQNYTERWYFNKVERDWDIANQTEVCDTSYGFYRVYDFSSNVSMDTRLYGYYTPIRKWFGDKVDRIRHVVTPRISYSYHPDFGSDLFKFYDAYTKTIVDKNNVNPISEQEVIYSPYSGGMFGVPGRGVSSNLSFSLKNNVEMKIKDKNDSTGLSYKKVSLIDDLSLSWGYNFAADSLNWNNLSASVRLKLTKRFSLNLSGQFDPYCYVMNDRGSVVRTNMLRWDYGLPMYFKGTSTQFSYTFNNSTFKKKDKKDKDGKQDDDVADDALDDPFNTSGIDPLTGEPIPVDEEDIGKRETEEKKERKKGEVDEDGYEKLEIPWSLNVSFSMGVYESRKAEDYLADRMCYRLRFRHNLTFSGNIQPTEKWRLNYSGSIDLTAMKINQMSLSVTRDLHCWTLSASISPVGVYKSFMVTIGVNASMLKDLKYDKRSDSSRDSKWL